MKCPNCGQDYPEGARLCPFCGTVLTPGGPEVQEPTPPDRIPAIVPLTPPGIGPVEIQPVAGSSAPAKASLWLGIGSLVTTILVVVATFAAVAVWIANQPPELVTQLQEAPEQIQRLLENPQYQDAVMPLALISLGSMGCCSLAEIAAVLGIVLGIVGLTREKGRPTRNGRSHSIVGIVCSVLPLLCCVGGIIIQLLSTAGA